MNRTGLKYYLRALGIGIIVTALLMGYSQKGQAQMTDEEIRQRAAQLGMTESQGVLAELATAPPETNPTLQALAEPTASPAPTPGEPIVSPTPIPTEEPEASSTPASTKEPAVSPTPAPTEEPAASPTPAPTEDPVASPTPTVEPAQSPVPAENDTSDSAGEVITLVVNRGESSVTVSKSLEELGLVEDYRAFDRYLCDKGYDHSICSGTHEIPLGATEEEIARIICKLQ